MKHGIGRAIPYHAMFDEAFRADPYPFYRYLQSEAPVVWDDVLQAWVVTRAADIDAVLHDADTFLSDRVSLGRQRFPQKEFKQLFDVIELLMLQSDSDRHVRLRHLAAQAFKRRAIEGYAPQVHSVVEELLAQRSGSASMEFVSEFATPLPVLIISRILGIPPEDRVQIKKWCDAFSIVALNFYSKISNEQLQAGAEAVEALSEYLGAQVEQRRGQDHGDLLSALVRAEDKGEGLSFDELLANVILLLNAGNETTTVLLTNAAYLLCTHGDIQDQLRANPSEIPKMVEETLRYLPPVQFIGRLVARDAKLGGESLRKGDLVLTFLGAAGRDAKEIANADEFRLDRPRSPHVSFGTGPHVCLGLQLARLEARIAFEELLAGFSSIRLSSDQLEFGPNLNLRTYARLPIEFEPLQRP